MLAPSSGSLTFRCSIVKATAGCKHLSKRVGTIRSSHCSWFLVTMRNIRIIRSYLLFLIVLDGEIGDCVEIWYSCVRRSLMWFFYYSQQVATIFDYLFLKCSTCFGWFLHPSSGAHNCTHSFRYCQPILLQAGIVAEMELPWKFHLSQDTSLQHLPWKFHLIHDTSLQQYRLTIPEAECTVMCSWWWAEEPSKTCRAF